MPETTQTPVATLGGVTLPGTGRPADPAALQDSLTVLRRAKDSQRWQRVPAAPGMALLAGDVLRLKGDQFRALGARAFTVDSALMGDGSVMPPNGLELHAHERAHQSTGARVTPVNDAYVDQIEREAAAIEEMVLTRPAPAR